MPSHTERSTRRKGTAAIAAGVLIALAGGAAIAWSMQSGDHGGPAALASGALATSTQGTSAGTSSAATSGSASHTSKRPSTTIARPTGNSKPVQIANPAGAACIPKSLTVSDVGIVDERVVPMGTNSQGQIYPPPHTTMWYNRSAQPGQRGISVIAGHVTYDGPDNFYNLRDVSIGTKVTVVCTNNKVVRLAVTHTESVLKTKLTTDQRVWGGSATPVVTLVTCDIKSPIVNQHHLSNFVVWTKPV